jgi:hypothetical protein
VEFFAGSPALEGRTPCEDRLCEGQLLISPIAFSEFSIAYPDGEAAKADSNLRHIFYDSTTPAAAYLATLGDALKSSRTNPCFHRQAAKSAKVSDQKN